MPPKRWTGAALVSAALLAAGPAWAHSEFSAVAPFWSGVLHLLVSPLAMATLIGLVVTLAGRREESMLWCLCIAGAVALVAAATRLAVPPAWVAAGAVLVGLLAASGWTPGLAAALVIATIAGFCTGRAVDLDTPAWMPASGAAGMMIYLAHLGMVSLWHLESRPRFSAALRIGRRVVGAWVAAIGLLLGTLALKKIGA